MFDDYGASIQASSADSSIYEEGINTPDLGEALRWVRQRTSWILVRPAWDQGVHYWAGEGAVPGDLDTGQPHVPTLPLPPWPAP